MSIKVEISLFVNKKSIGRMRREHVPRIGETIIIDCGEMVRVIEVSHQWDDPLYIQVNTVPFEEKEI